MKAWIAFALLLLPPVAPLPAQETRPAVEGQRSPPARLADLAWLAGTWEGQGITGQAREIYGEPMGGQIAGHFTQARGQGIWFYEIVTIAQVGDSLEYRLRHFNEDLTGWEERNEVRRFPLVAVEGDAWYFDDLTLRRDGPDRMIGAVRVRNRDGTSNEVVFRYRRVRG
jgi:hypothetical protein